jgi:hypothetical protein
MHKSSSHPRRSLSLARAVLAPALAILLLGLAAPQLPAQTVSDNFNGMAGTPAGTNVPSGWVSYLLPNSYYDSNQGQNVLDFGGLQFQLGTDTYYGQGTFYYPTNPFGGAGNYAFRMTTPAITNDPVPLLFSRTGAFQTTANYTGRFMMGVDLINFNPAWDEEALGLAFYANLDNPFVPSTYVVAWGPGLNQFGLAMLKVTGTYPDLVPSYGIIAEGTPNATALSPNHSYRMVASSHDGTTFLVTLYDNAQPNNPWQSAITVDTNLVGGYCGMMVVDVEDTRDGQATQGSDATWDNFYATAPAPSALPVTVTDLTPQPAGKAISRLVEVGIFNRDTSVNTGTIGLYLDGVRLTSGVTISNAVYKPYNDGLFGPNGETYPTSFPGATVGYLITDNFAFGSRHTNTVVFQDSANTWFTNSWPWTVSWPVPYAPSGSLTLRGFDARLVQSYSATDPGYANMSFDGGLNNSIASAQAVLNNQYTVNFSSTNIVQLVNFDITGPGNDAYNGNPVTNWPGLCLSAGGAFVNSFAVEVMAYVQLSAGTNTFFVDSDDAAGVYSGNSLTDTSVPLLANDGSVRESFDWIVVTPGLYPLHILYQQGGGGANLGLCTVNRTANTTNLVNSASSVQAFYPLVCQSSTSIKGPFTPDAAANASNSMTISGSLCESGVGPISNQTVTGGTITVPIPTAPKYYRLDGPRKTRITSFTKSGTNMIINYQVY